MHAGLEFAVGEAPVAIHDGGEIAIGESAAGEEIEWGERGNHGPVTIVLQAGVLVQFDLFSPVLAAYNRGV